jgi:hypothetical protein
MYVDLSDSYNANLYRKEAAMSQMIALDACFCVDSGGFTAARKWGKYPWTHQQYIDFIREMSRDVPVQFCANMDYACERSVNRSKYNTNIDRIKATIRNEITLQELAPDLPWLPVLQGNNLEEY